MFLTACSIAVQYCMKTLIAKCDTCEVGCERACEADSDQVCDAVQDIYYGRSKITNSEIRNCHYVKNSVFNYY